MCTSRAEPPRRLLYAGPRRDWPDYRVAVGQAAADRGLAVDVVDQADPGAVDYLIYAPGHGPDDFAPFSRLRAVLNLWAGVEKILDNPTLQVPLVRMVDPDGLTAGMVEWVTGHVLRHHLGLDRHLAAAPGDWSHRPPPLAADRPVAILGLGELGQACATALARLGFPVTGWSRSPKTLPGVTCRAGAAALDAVLAGADILVLLLPRTPATETLLDASALARLPASAVVLNPGRGELIDDAALLAALDSGHLAHATLDVFRREPLPADHPFWRHPGVTVTPHIASCTRPASASVRLVEAILALERGRTPAGLVDRTRGY